MDSIYSYIPSQSPDKLIKFFQPKIAKVYYKNRSHDYLTDRKSDDSVYTFLKKLEHIHADSHSKTHRLFHLHFELGYLLNDLPHLVSDEMPLVIELEYEKLKKINKDQTSKLKIIKPQFKLIETPSYTEYKKSFAIIMQHLLDGNFYQLNFTHRSLFSIDGFFRAEDYIHTLFNQKHVGAYAHATVIGTESKIILSNSPELLFKRNFKQDSIEIYSTPIKGTQKLEKSRLEAWNKLKNSKKDECELNMISDLLRNDLSRIDQPNAKIIKKKKPLFVPGLVHQYSIVRAKISEQTTLLKILSCLFPGGSVTGAPKKTVMQNTHDLENSSRGIYCGSTLILSKNLMCANINIRTAEINLENREMLYGSGGGITLLSLDHEEYSEMLMKRDSFMKIFH